jgi:hypothetical protein
MDFDLDEFEAIFEWFSANNKGTRFISPINKTMAKNLLTVPLN